MSGVIESAVARWAADSPDRAAVSNAAGESLTFGQLDNRADQVAAALSDATGPVAFIGTNALTWAEVMVGANRRGVPALPVNWRLSAAETDRLLDHARPSVIVVEVAQAPLIGAEPGTADGTLVYSAARELLGTYESWRDRATLGTSEGRVTGDCAVLVYTSGTSGTPKGVQITDQNIEANLATPAPWQVDEQSVVGVPAPLFHVSGTGWVFYCLCRGAHFVSTAGISATRVLDILRSARATHMLTVPAILQTLVQAPEARSAGLADLGTVIYGGSPMPPALIAEAQAVLGCDFVQTYGMTETCGPITFLTPEDHREGGVRLASAGRVAPGVSVEIRTPADANGAAPGETGEVWTRSALITPGYLRNDEQNGTAFAADGWFRTGDCGYLDAEGYLFLTDRLSDMIITGGENVYPVEVENVLAEHPDVAEVAVVGVPDERWGETVVAAVVLTPESSATPDDLIAFCRERLAHYKCPTRLVLAAELPRTGSGKVMKKDLRTRLRENAART